MGKKSLGLYCDLIHTIEKMPHDKAGELFIHILKYVNDLNPISEDLIINLTFEPIKQQLKRDLQKWDNELLKKSEGGILGNLKRWHNDLYLQVVDNKITIHKANEIASTRIASHTDTNQSDSIASVAVSVNDNVSVSVTDTDIKFNFKKSLLSVGANEKLVNEWIEVRKKKKSVNSETALNGFLKQQKLSKRDINFVLEKCVEKSWAGFEASWLTNIGVEQPKKPTK